MSRRRLTEEERALWKGVTRSIKPLRAHPPEDEPVRSAGSGAKGRADGDGAMAPVPRSRAAERSAAPAAISPKPAVPPLAPLERRLKKRVARGAHEIDVRLDLHGMTQAEAHGALLHFLGRAQRRGASLALIITGKGGMGGESGVLRRQVPLWLRLPEFRGFVIGFESAGRAHGGEGALYVRLRKGRE